MMVIWVGLLFICVGVLQIGACFTTPITGDPTEGLILCVVGIVLIIAILFRIY